MEAKSRTKAGRDPEEGQSISGFLANFAALSAAAAAAATAVSLLRDTAG